MFTYIKYNIRGKFIELPNELTSDLYSNLGTTYNDYLNGLWVKLTDEQVEFHQTNPSASVYEVFTMQLKPAYVRTLLDAQNEKVNSINRYHATHLSDFKLDTAKIWFSEQERSVKYTEALRAKENGSNVKVSSTVTLTPDQTIALLELMSNRQTECQTAVETMINEVKALEDIETVDAYVVADHYTATTEITTADLDKKVNSINKTSKNRQVEILLTKTINTMSLTDEDALEVKMLYPLWSSFIGKSLSTGMRVLYENKLYNVRQEVSTVLENQFPSIDTAALYEEINEVNAGTYDDPIPYNNNMELEEGKYYIQNDIIYLCNRSTGQAVYNNLVDLVGIYVEIANE